MLIMGAVNYNQEIKTNFLLTQELQQLLKILSQYQNITRPLLMKLKLKVIFKLSTIKQKDHIAKSQPSLLQGYLAMKVLGWKKNNQQKKGFHNPSKRYLVIFYRI
jgi:hypothetical protein